MGEFTLTFTPRSLTPDSSLTAPRNAQQPRLIMPFTQPYSDAVPSPTICQSEFCGLPSTEHNHGVPLGEIISIAAYRTSRGNVLDPTAHTHSLIIHIKHHPVGNWRQSRRTTIYTVSKSDIVRVTLEEARLNKPTICSCLL